MTAPSHPPLPLGLVGVGRFGSFLAEAVGGLPHVVLRAVADTRPGAAQRLSARHHTCAVQDWTDLLEDGDVDAVVVSTPPADHVAITVQALGSGRRALPEVTGCRRGGRRVRTCCRNGPVSSGTSPPSDCPRTHAPTASSNATTASHPRQEAAVARTSGCGVREGTDAVWVADAATRSASEGRRVDLPPAPTTPVSRHTPSAPEPSTPTFGGQNR